MLPPLIQRARRSARHRERGVTMALVALSIVGIIAMAALSIDIGTLYQSSGEAQRAADAGALAAARLISMSGLTGDPANTATWGQTCASGGPAGLAAVAAAQQNSVGGSSIPAASINVTYSAGNAAVSPGSPDCTSAGTEFPINPVVTVSVQQTNLPTFFAHVFGVFNKNWNTVSASASATAEAFNSSNAGSYAVQPRCVKPWMVPNYDPLNPSGCNLNCRGFVNPGADGSIVNPGLVASGGVIGESFWLVADCGATGTACGLNGQPQANIPLPAPQPNNLQYVPGQVPPLSTATAIPASKVGACSEISGSAYAQAIAGCDQSTKYQCGEFGGNTVDLVDENPVSSYDTANGAQCLIHQGTDSTSDILTAASISGQDTLDPFATNQVPPPTYPFQIQAGTNNPLTNAGLTSGTAVTSSTSIVSVPIYNTGVTINPPTTSVTIVGFLQVFINFADNSGNVYVTVMNVSGCGQNPGTTLYGTSPVPVRLITPPTS